jgi:hypothetical protein
MEPGDGSLFGEEILRRILRRDFEKRFCFGGLSIMCFLRVDFVKSM